MKLLRLTPRDRNYRPYYFEFENFNLDYGLAWKLLFSEDLLKFGIQYVRKFKENKLITTVLKKQQYSVNKDLYIECDWDVIDKQKLKGTDVIHAINLTNYMYVHIYDKNSPGSFITIKEEIYRNLGESRRDAMLRISKYWEGELSLSALLCAEKFKNNNNQSTMNENVITGTTIRELTTKLKAEASVSLKDAHEAVKKAVEDTKSVEHDVILNKAKEILKNRDVKVTNRNHKDGMRKVYEVVDDIGNVILLSFLVFQEATPKTEFFKNNLDKLIVLLKNNMNDVKCLEDFRHTETSKEAGFEGSYLDLLVEDVLCHMAKTLNEDVRLDNLVKVEMPYMVVENGTDEKVVPNKSMFTKFYTHHNNSTASAALFFMRKVKHSDPDFEAKLEAAKEAAKKVLMQIVFTRPLVYDEKDLLSSIKNEVKANASSSTGDLKAANDAYEAFIKQAVLNKQKMVTVDPPVDATVEDYLRSNNVELGYFVRI